MSVPTRDTGYDIGIVDVQQIALGLVMSRLIWSSLDNVVCGLLAQPTARVLCSIKEILSTGY